MDDDEMLLIQAQVRAEHKELMDTSRSYVIIGINNKGTPSYGVNITQWVDKVGIQSWMTDWVAEGDIQEEGAPEDEQEEGEYESDD